MLMRARAMATRCCCPPEAERGSMISSAFFPSRRAAADPEPAGAPPGREVPRYTPGHDHISGHW